LPHLDPLPLSSTSHTYSSSPRSSASTTFQSYKLVAYSRDEKNSQLASLQNLSQHGYSRASYSTRSISRRYINCWFYVASTEVWYRTIVFLLYLKTLSQLLRLYSVK
jgi:hypothetical protein